MSDFFKAKIIDASELPFADYLALKAYSNSFSGALTPAHYQEDQEDTEAFQTGRLAHQVITGIIEETPVVVPDDWNFSTNKTKDAARELLDKHGIVAPDKFTKEEFSNMLASKKCVAITEAEADWFELLKQT